MSSTLLIAVYGALIVLSSLLGGWLPSLIRLTHTRVQLMMSGVGGLMLGIGLFHLLPHAVNPEFSLDRAIWWLMAGLLTTFFLIRVFHAHEHAPVEAGDESHVADRGHDQREDSHGGHAHDHHRQPHAVGKPNYRWVGIALGLSLHTLLDGVALAASVMHDRHHTPEMFLYGFAAFVGIALHKPLDSLSITSLMAAGGWTAGSRQLVNFGYATMCPVGAVLFYLGVHQSAHQAVLIGCALAFAAGIFICIALSDLLPELQFHSHDRLRLSAALLVGVALAYCIGYLEPDHVHSHSNSARDGGKHRTSHGHEGHPTQHSPHDHPHD